jgi:hypothetical protein
MDILCEGLGIGKLQFLIYKRRKISAVVFSSSIFGHQNPGSGLDPDPDALEMLDLYSDRIH